MDKRIECKQIEIINGITPEVKVRALREKECFPYINRGELWYNHLTEGQRAELDAWYSAWLDAPQTLTLPTRPSWLE